MRSKKLLIVSLTLLFSIIVIGVPASIALAQSSGKAQVNNKAPTIVSVAISPDADLGRPGVQINPTASGTTAVSVNAQVRDDNGHNDITTVSVAVYKPDGTTIHVPPRQCYPLFRKWCQ